MDFSELEKITSNDLARLAAEEDVANKPASKQQKHPKVAGKKATVAEKSISKQPTDPKVAGEKSTAEITLLSENKSLENIGLTSSYEVKPLKTEADVNT